MVYVLRASLLVGLAGCSVGIRVPDLGGIYNQAARYHDADRNPVVVIPGILGTKLKDSESGRVVWGAFTRTSANPRRPEDARLVALPMRDGAALAELTDGVVQDGVLDQVQLNLIGLPVELNAYANILATLGAGGYRDELLGRSGAIDYGDDHFTCFQFGYDWRRDIVDSAKNLHEYLVERKAYLQKEFRQRYGVENADVKFDLVAHSMGGLVARYYLMYGPNDLPADGSIPRPTWVGAQYIRRAVLIGTPNAGSVKAFVQLVNGAKFAPLLPSYSPAVLGTMPSVFELMPRSRHNAVLFEDGTPVSDLYDVSLWEQMGWGLASAKQDRELQKLLPDVPDAATRRRIALDHLRKTLERTKQFHAALDAPATPPPGLDLHLFAGDAVPTDTTVVVNRASGKLGRRTQSPGDGTVLRSSALHDERLGGNWSPALQTPIPWANVTFLFEDHLGLTKSAAFSDNVLYLLLEDGR